MKNASFILDFLVLNLNKKVWLLLDDYPYNHVIILDDQNGHFHIEQASVLRNAIWFDGFILPLFPALSLFLSGGFENVI